MQTHLGGSPLISGALQTDLYLLNSKIKLFQVQIDSQAARHERTQKKQIKNWERLEASKILSREPRRH